MRAAYGGIWAVVCCLCTIVSATPQVLDVDVTHDVDEDSLVFFTTYRGEPDLAGTDSIAWNFGWNSANLNVTSTPRMLRLRVLTSETESLEYIDSTNWHLDIDPAAPMWKLIDSIPYVIDGSTITFAIDRDDLLPDKFETLFFEAWTFDNGALADIHKGSYTIPEPATICLLACGAIAISRKRKS